MPLSHVRYCRKCDAFRYAPCSTGCRLDPDTWWPTIVPKADDAATVD